MRRELSSRAGRFDRWRGEVFGCGCRVPARLVEPEAVVAKDAGEEFELAYEKMVPVPGGPPALWRPQVLLRPARVGKAPWTPGRKS